MANFFLSNGITLAQKLAKYEINTPLRIWHFLAQCHQETGGFAWVKEFGANSYFNKYEPKTAKGKELGNIYVGDGAKFKGRGLIQITGRGNYTKYKNYSGVDIVTNPALAERMDIAIDVACWYWRFGSSKGDLNLFADANDIVAVTKGVNGGTNHLQNRKDYLAFYSKSNILDVLQQVSNPFTIV